MTMDWEASRRAALLNAREAVCSEYAIDRLTEIVVEKITHLKLIIRTTFDGDQEYHLCGRDFLAESLRSENFQKWADWLSQRVCPQSASINSEDVAIDQLLGRAAGVYFGRNPSDESLHVITRVLEVFADAWETFAPAAAEVMDQASKQALTTLLQTQVNSFTTAPRRMADVLGTNTCAMVDKFREGPRLSDVWQETPYAGGFRVSHSIVFDVLYRSNPKAFLALLDAFPHPEPARQVIEYVVKGAEMSSLLHLFGLSSPAFDNDGQWLVQIKTPFLILSKIVEEISSFAQTDESKELNPIKGFKSAVNVVIAAVVGRQDGVFLGYAWLQQLITVARFDLRSGQSAGEFVDHVFIFLLIELAKALPPRGNAVQWVSQEAEIWRRARAVAAIAGMALGKSGGSDATAQLIDALLSGEPLTTVGLEQSIGRWPMPERLLVGLSIASFPLPASWFDAQWRKLMPVRDRSRYSFGDLNDRWWEVDLLLVAWSLCGLERIDQNSPDARLLWLTLHQAIKESILTQIWVQRSLSWQFLYRFLSGLLAARFKTEPTNPHALTDLRELLAPLLCIDAKIADVLLTLKSNGIPTQVISEAVPDPKFLIDLLRIVAQDETDLQRRRRLHAVEFSNLHERIAILIEELVAARAG